MESNSYRYWMSSLSDLCINLSAAWYAVVLISPVFVNIKIYLTDLLVAFIFGSILLILSIRFKEVNPDA